MQGIASGIGSFHFELRSSDEPIVNVWPEKVRRALEAIPSVRDVEIDVPSTYAIDDPEEGSDVFYCPHPMSGAIRFRVNIPERMQKEVFPYWRGTRWENFTVLTLYGSGDPATFVFIDGAGPEDDATLAVGLVRNFIEREMGRLEGIADGVNFVCRGPSPFHVDLRFEPGQPARDDDQAFERTGMTVDKRQGEGYPRLTVRFDQARFASAYEAATSFITITFEQLSFFYRLVARGDRRADQASEVRRQVDRLIAVHRRSGVKAWFLRNFRSGAWARELNLLVLVLTYRFSEDQRSAKEALARLCEDEDLPTFRSWIDDELAVDHNEDLKNCREIAEVLEPRRLREINAMWVLVVAITSAILGALLKGLAG
ncbi:hypothetical protein ABZU25_14210 [Micromonospora sp. NPDC005215]|uniref:hypothetical protein n=1 Tax=Micromonospora sp. NPDC005215 TaxID=3157024 RepID=UPI0033AF722D